jgi:hypothetical protein
MTSERIPLILPQAFEPVQVVNGRPVTVMGGVNNTYIHLNHRKAYHYVTLTAKLRLDKLTGVKRRFYGSFFYTDNRVSGTTSDPALASRKDPHRTGKTLADIPDLFTQRAYAAAVMVETLKSVNVMGDVGWETWRSDYTHPAVDYRTDSIGGGFAYDLPWGRGKLELRYKHIRFTNAYVAANNYKGHQVFSTLRLLF